MKAQRLSRLDERRGCRLVWQSSTCRPAKSLFFPAHQLSKSSSRDVSRLQKQKQQVVAAAPVDVGQDNRLMFWAFLGDMSGIPKTGWRASGCGWDVDARSPAALGRKHRTISGCYGIPDGFLIIII